MKTHALSLFVAVLCCSCATTRGKTPLRPPHQASYPTLIAIAPPQSTPEILSDELGTEMESLVSQRYPSAKILAFEDSVPVFNSFAYNHSSVIRDPYRDKLYGELKISHLLETQTERTQEGILLQSKLVDVFSDQEVDHFSELLPYSKLKNGNDSFLNKLSSLVSLVPNTFFVDLSDTVLYFSRPSQRSLQPYTPISDPQSSVLKYLTSVALRNSRSPKLSELQGVFRLIPDINFYYDRFHFERDTPPNPVQDMSFTWVSISAGLGAEFGLESPLGYFYLDLIPSGAIHWVTSPYRSSNKATLELNAEIGYSIFLSQRIALRLFGRALTGSASQWSDLLSEAAREPIQLDVVSHGIYGLAIGYYFPESRSVVKKALF